MNGTWRTDMPFVLESVNMSDDYEGDFSTRRAIIYTLEFETRVRFYGPTDTGATIRQTETNFATNAPIPTSAQTLTISPANANPSSTYTVLVDYGVPTPDLAVVTVGTGTGTFTVNEKVHSTITGTLGVVSSVQGNIVRIIRLDDRFNISENLVGETSGANRTITAVEYTVDAIAGVTLPTPNPTLEFDLI
jgi:hypothetical protein